MTEGLFCVSSELLRQLRTLSESSEPVRQFRTRATAGPNRGPRPRAELFDSSQRGAAGHLNAAPTESTKSRFRSRPWLVAVVSVGLVS